MKYVVGVDEAGRGPWAGPVYAAAVILNPRRPIEGLKDSKKLTAEKREFLSCEIKQKALSFGIASATVQEIDKINILQAVFLAMQRALAQLSYTPTLILVDGHLVPPVAFPTKGIVGGDDLEPVISAASILAKVARDAEMRQWDEIYPLYGFRAHKGYGTKKHQEMLACLGPSPIHRKSFAPIKALIGSAGVPAEASVNNSLILCE